LLYKSNYLDSLIVFLAKLLPKGNSEITSQLNSVLTHRAKLYSSLAAAGNLACASKFSWRKPIWLAEGEYSCCHQGHCNKKSRRIIGGILLLAISP
jgi:hypothetical protein